MVLEKTLESPWTPRRSNKPILKEISPEYSLARGSISFDLNDPRILTVCHGEGDPRNYQSVTENVPDQFYLLQEQAFVNAVLGNRDPLFPTLSDGSQGQKVVDAILTSSEERRWVKI